MLPAARQEACGWGGPADARSPAPQGVLCAVRDVPCRAVSAGGVRGRRLNSRRRAGGVASGRLVLLRGKCCAALRFGSAPDDSRITNWPPPGSSCLCRTLLHYARPAFSCLSWFPGELRGGCVVEWRRGKGSKQARGQEAVVCLVVVVHLRRDVAARGRGARATTRQASGVAALPAALPAAAQTRAQTPAPSTSLPRPLCSMRDLSLSDPPETMPCCSRARCRALPALSRCISPPIASPQVNATSLNSCCLRHQRPSLGRGAVHEEVDCLAGIPVAARTHGFPDQASRLAMLPRFNALCSIVLCCRVLERSCFHFSRLLCRCACVTSGSP